MSDFNLLIKIRNGRMLKKMREHGFYTAASLSLATGVTQGNIGELLMLKRGPIAKNGDVRLVALKICEVLNATMQDLWPASMCEYRAPKTNVEVDLSLEQVAGLLDHDDDPMLAIENRDILGRLYDVLTPRERRVVEGRSREETLDEIAEEFGVTGQRIRQIEAKAHRKMRGKARQLGLMRNISAMQSKYEIEEAAENWESQYGWGSPDRRAQSQAEAAQEPSPPTMHYPSKELIETKERLDREMTALQRQKESP